MKKIKYLLLAGALTLGIAACDDDGGQVTTPNVFETSKIEETNAPTPSTSICTTPNVSGNVSGTTIPSVTPSKPMEDDHIHNFGKVEYIWSADYSTVTATRVCSSNASHIETETVNTTSEIIQNISCSNDEITKYTAIFKNSLFEEQSANICTSQRLGHDKIIYKIDCEDAIHENILIEGLLDSTGLLWNRCYECNKLICTSMYVENDLEVWKEKNPNFENDIKKEYDDKNNLIKETLSGYDNEYNVNVTIEWNYDNGLLSTVKLNSVDGKWSEVLTYNNLGQIINYEVLKYGRKTVSAFYYDVNGNIKECSAFSYYNDTFEEKMHSVFVVKNDNIIEIATYLSEEIDSTDYNLYFKANLEYDLNGNNTRYLLYDDEEILEEEYIYIYMYIYKYDENRNIIKRIEKDYDSEGIIDYWEEYSYEYDIKGNIIKEINKEFDSEGNIDYWYESTYEYDSNGNIIKDICKNYDINGNVESSSEYIYEYNENSQIIRLSREFYDSNDNLESKEEYTYEYDSNGNKTLETYKSYKEGNINERYEYIYEYDEYGYKILESYKKYDSEDNIVSNYKYTYEYDENGKKLKESYERSDNKYEKYSYEYDINGNIIKHIKYYFEYNGEITYIYEYNYEYDSNNNIIYESEKQLDKEMNLQYKKLTSISYNNDGSLNSKLFEVYDSENLTYKYIYVYDEDENYTRYIYYYKRSNYVEETDYNDEWNVISYTYTYYKNDNQIGFKNVAIIVKGADGKTTITGFNSGGYIYDDDEKVISYINYYYVCINNTLEGELVKYYKYDYESETYSYYDANDNEISKIEYDALN